MNNKAKEKEIRQILARVPKELHGEIRQRAFDSQRSLNDIVQEALREWNDKQREAERRAGESR